MYEGIGRMIKIDYDLLKLEYSAKSILIKDEYIEIISLDNSVTKFDINYLPEKYIIKEED